MLIFFIDILKCSCIWASLVGFVLILFIYVFIMMGFDRHGFLKPILILYYQILLLPCISTHKLFSRLFKLWDKETESHYLFILA